MATRRAFINQIARAGGATAAYASMQALGLLATRTEASPLPQLPAGAGTGVRVAILGGGIAGLVTAWELRKAGYACTILEARDRPGGRNWTVRQGTRVDFADGTSQRCAFDPGLYFNAGPARLPSIHTHILGYCRELGVPLEIEVNTSRSARLQTPAAFDGRPVEQRQVINDTRGHVSELLAKAIDRHALDHEFVSDDREKLLAFLKKYGDLSAKYKYVGSKRSGVKAEMLHGIDDTTARDPLSLSSLLDADFWDWMLFEEGLDMQATMMQPVGGMDRIPYAFAERLKTLIRYKAEVRDIKQTSNGVRVLYRDMATSTDRSLDADYCVCALPISILKTLPHCFSDKTTAALQDVEYAGAYKVAWQSRRFWEQDDHIYGGISFLRGPVHLLWYPSAQIMSKEGVLIAGYANEKDKDSEFGKLPSMEAKLAASRAAVEAVHPGRGGELSKPMYVSWAQIPYNLGSWVERSAKPDGSNYYTGPFKQLLEADGRIIFAGDHLTRLVAWQEGAALSAHRAVAVLVEHQRATVGVEPARQSAAR